MAAIKTIEAGPNHTDGVQLGKSGEKVAIYGETPLVQHTSTGQTAGFTAVGGTGVNDQSTFTGGVGTKAYTIGDVVKALKNIGVMADS